MGDGVNDPQGRAVEALCGKETVDFMGQTGERPYGPGIYPEVTESRVELTVDDAAGKVSGTTVLAYRTTSRFG